MADCWGESERAPHAPVTHQCMQWFEAAKLFHTVTGYRRYMYSARVRVRARASGSGRAIPIQRNSTAERVYRIHVHLRESGHKGGSKPRVGGVGC